MTTFFTGHHSTSHRHRLLQTYMTQARSLANFPPLSTECYGKLQAHQRDIVTKASFVWGNEPRVGLILTPTLAR